MARVLYKRNDAHITSPWDSTALRARCAEPEGEPTEVIPRDLLSRLLAETARDGTPDTAAPRFDIVELDAEDVIIDESAFEEAFAEMVGTAATG